LIIELPKNLIDSNKFAAIGESIDEDSFAVMVDNQITTLDKIKNTSLLY
jgi:hypothetical protein